MPGYHITATQAPTLITLGPEPGNHSGLRTAPAVTWEPLQGTNVPICFFTRNFLCMHLSFSAMAKSVAGELSCFHGHHRRSA